MPETRDFDLQGFVPYLLNQAAEASSRGFQSYYKDRYGMLRTEWRVVFHLGRYGDLTAKDICTKAGLHKTKVSRAVAALAHKKFLTRTEVQQDRRHELLRLTPRGAAAFDDLTQAAQRFDASLLARFSDQEVDVLRKCLVQIADL